MADVDDLLERVARRRHRAEAARREADQAQGALDAVRTQIKKLAGTDDVKKAHKALEREEAELRRLREEELPPLEAEADRLWEGDDLEEDERE